MKKLLFEHLPESLGIMAAGHAGQGYEELRSSPETLFPQLCRNLQQEFKLYQFGNSALVLAKISQYLPTSTHVDLKVGVSKACWGITAGIRRIRGNFAGFCCYNSG